MPNTDSLNRTLFIGDNLPVLRGIDSESIDLIATDPPFNKGVKAFEGIVTAGTDRKGKKVSYKDVWTWETFNPRGLRLSRQTTRTCTPSYKRPMLRLARTWERSSAGWG